MDIANPVGSEITTVDFGFLTSKDIKNLSVKQIVSPDTLDKLQHPIPGGLYDLALGAFGKNLCATCGLDERFCPGHIGHVELPVPAYNPLFFVQVYNFIRASCIYCSKFKLREAETHKYMCKLQLLQHGLIAEMQDLESVNLQDLRDDDGSEAEEGEEEEEEEEGTKSKAKQDHAYIEKIKAKRMEFVRQKISQAMKDGRTTSAGIQTATVLEERKKVVHDLIKALVARKKCDNCGMFSPSYRKDGYVKIFETELTDKQRANNQVKGLERPNMLYDDTPKRKGDEGEVDLEKIPVAKAGVKSSSRYVVSTEVRNILRKTFKKEQALCKVLFQVRPNYTENVSPDMFFIHHVVVPPTRFRAPQQLGDEIHSNMQSDLIAKILTTALRIRDLTDQMQDFPPKDRSPARANVFNMLMNSFVTIQADVNGFLDSTKVPGGGGTVPVPGVKQALEKKEGLFRKNMMGKRVNYAARSVISPDPNLETTEIGVPPVFAINLTYPEPVTDYNVEELRKAVINGPDKWPGANQIQNEDGTVVNLKNMTVEQRTALANQLQTPSSSSVMGVVNKKVYRHLRNQDVVLMNRQPTLHKASMMGHKVRVLPKEKTLRLHYANTGAYNADFDGDEMNMHFPQNETARAEAFLLANTNSQYLTPTSGKPLRGLIQDHISAGVWLTNKDTFFTRQQYQQLVYGSVRPEDGHTTRSRIVTVPPAVFKPVPLWTGKQVITTCLLNIKPLDRPGLNLTSKNKIKNDYWGEGSKEETVIFQDGELLCGILDKSQYGAADHGFVHSVHEIYGPTTAGMLLSVLGRLFTKYIMQIGFTCGMDDLHLTDEGNKWRKDILVNNRDFGLEAAVEAANLPKGTKADDPILLQRLEEILRDDNKLGVLDAITQNKASGVASNVVKTCIPAGTEKRFPYNNMQAMALSGAKGSGVNVSQIMCMLGQQALEGRRVPVMVSGKTLPSFKPFDTAGKAGGYIAGRFFSGIKPQEYYFHCMAGREGLIDTAVKTSRSGYLQRCLIKQLEGVHTSYDNTVRDSDGTLVQFLYGGDAVDVIKESHLREFDFCAMNYDSLLSKHQPGDGQIENMDVSEAIGYAKKVKKHMKRHADEPHYSHPNKYDPVLTKYNPSRSIGSVSERFSDDLERFIEKNQKLFADKKDKHGMTEKKFRALMQLKYMQSVVDPGEAVGIIASQSIGEPSTQMTLNTFHFAGHGAANVTLGIPRMREIIMTASENIATPQMTLPLLKSITNEQADAFCRSVAKVRLSELVDNVVVTERTGITDSGSSARSYDIKINFFPEDEYQNEYDVSKEYLADVLTKRFVTKLEGVVIKEIKKQKKNIPSVNVGEKLKNSESVMASSGAAASAAANADGGADSDADNDDGDDEKVKSRTKQAVSYDEPDEEEASVMKKNQKDDDEFDEDDESDGNDKKQATYDSSDDSDVEMKNTPGALSSMAKERQSDVVGSHRSIRAFNFDDENGEWCQFTMEFPASTKKLLMVNIIEDLCRSHVVREVPRIGRCLRPDKDGRELVTEGVNFAAMWEEDMFVDVNDIRSNDIVSVLKTYGVEAARNTIVQEINKVFQTYAIAVNLRHLDLIADMMTREGTYLPFNRQGVDTGTSPFMKMSFETTCQFLTKTVLDGGSDKLESPSSRIVTGRVSKVGTGSFDVFTPVFIR